MFRARCALREYRPKDIQNTILLHLRLFEEETSRSGHYHTGYLRIAKRGVGSEGKARYNPLYRAYYQ
ncbi:hypothetical protein BH24ACT21_BH24ACT21_12270 [soil metagenome]